MKKVNLLELIITLCCVFLFISCDQGDPIKSGKYQIISFRVPKDKIDQMHTMTKQLPVFEFSNRRRVKITPDFEFGYFKDSLFKYKLNLEERYLYLYGDNIEHKISCEFTSSSERHSYKLNLNTKNIISIDIIEEKKY